MKITANVLIAVALTLALAEAQETMTNEPILKMFKAGLGEM